MKLWLLVIHWSITPLRNLSFVCAYVCVNVYVSTNLEPFIHCTIFGRNNPISARSHHVASGRLSSPPLSLPVCRSFRHPFITTSTYRQTYLIDRLEVRHVTHCASSSTECNGNHGWQWENDTRKLSRHDAEMDVYDTLLAYNQKCFRSFNLTKTLFKNTMEAYFFIIIIDSDVFREIYFFVQINVVWKH